MSKPCSSCTSSTEPSPAVAARLVLTTALALFAQAVSAERFEVKPGAEGNLVSFESKATMETFHGKTDRVSGYLELDPGAIGDSITVYLEVDLATLDTGIGMRNRHMRENHLETDRYPLAVFRGATVVGGDSHSLASGNTARFLVGGTMELHGVIRPMQATVDVMLESDDHRRLRVSTEFPITLADYEIERPRFLVLKLGETQKVTVNLIAVSGVPNQP